MAITQFKVMSFDTNGRSFCSFVCVNNRNLPAILQCFRDMVIVVPIFALSRGCSSLMQSLGWTPVFGMGNLASRN